MYQLNIGTDIEINAPAYVTIQNAEYVPVLQLTPV